MTDLVFNNEMRKIKASFPNGMNDDKIKIIYEKTQGLADQSFIAICNRILCTYKHAPTIADFIEMIGNAPRLVKPVQGTCGKCQDGIMSMRHKLTHIDYAFKCNCETGFNRSENWPKWIDSDFAHYEFIREEK
jgi:hypothetical protein